MPQSYVTSLVHAVSKMKIDDEIIWSSFASFIAGRHDQMSLRDLSTCVYSLTTISKHKPILLNFDDLYQKLELSLIKKFDSEKKDSQAIANAVLSYSKSANGSV